MRTISLNVTSDRNQAGLRMQVIEYRGILATRQFSDAGDYLVMVEWGGEEFDFNHLSDALRWVEDELNGEDQRRYYRSDADLHREWSVR
jgi:hypothetical protein